jgi:hypothetical protein
VVNSAGMRRRRSVLRSALCPGLVSPTEEGTRARRSALASNLMLDVLDKELEKRGHRFVRYADDCNIYVRSQKAGERVMAGIERFLEKRLKLKVNKAKSAVAKPSVRKFLSFSYTGGREPRRRIAPQAIARFKVRVRELTRRSCGRSLAQIVKELSVYLIGWRGYFGFCQTPSVLRSLTSGSGGGCAPSPGNSGSPDGLALPSCDAAASAGIWRQQLPEAPMALGGSQSVPRSTSPCQPASLVHSDYVPSQNPLPHNPANRRIRTRISGGVGGAEPRGSPYPASETPVRRNGPNATGSCALRPSRR